MEAQYLRDVMATISERLARVEEHRRSLDVQMNVIDARIDRLETSIENIDKKVDEILATQLTNRASMRLLEWLIGIFSTIALGVAAVHELMH